MNNPSSRMGHAAVGAILKDMDHYLPSDTIQRPDYRRIRQLYGLMNTAYRRTDTTETPEKEYKELRALEFDLRRRLNNLEAAKGIPAKMTQYLNELKNALDDALAKGVTTDFVMQGITDMLEESPNAQPEAQPELAKMIPDTKYKKCRAELMEARKKIQRLNEENNALTMRVKRLEAGMY
jgi:flagellar biosynthesis chaperone FliJ